MQDATPSVTGEEITHGIASADPVPPSYAGSRADTSERFWPLDPAQPLASDAQGHLVEGNTMQHLRLANYKITKGTFPEIVDTAKGGMLKTFKEQPGFVRYGLADTGEGTCVSISLWETHAQAEAAAPVAATWVREHLADRIELRSNQVGDLAFFEGVPATV